jgi:hypothetical protein
MKSAGCRIRPPPAGSGISGTDANVLFIRAKPREDQAAAGPFGLRFAPALGLRTQVGARLSFPESPMDARDTLSRRASRHPWFQRRRQRPHRRQAHRLRAEDLVGCYLRGASPGAGPLKVVDISPHGLALLAPWPFGPGDRLRLQLTNRTGLFAYAVELRAIRCAPSGRAFLTAGLFLEPLPADVCRQLLG